MEKKTIIIEYEEFGSSEDLPKDEQDLIAAAVAARDQAYAPYSKFKVGAAVLVEGGEIYTGSNQEVANLKVSCAERAALDSLEIGRAHV